MNSVEEVLKKNKEYEDAKRELEKKQEELIAINSAICTKEVENLTYESVKDLLSTISYRISDKEVLEKIKAIAQKKRIEKYPALLDAHYYPEIKEMDWLSVEEQLNLDDILANVRNRSEISALDDKTKEFLIDRKILEKNYVIGCNHNSFDCDSRVFNEEKVKRLKAYWEKERNEEETTYEEDEELHYGCFEIYCDRENIEITNLEEFEEHLEETRYKIIKNPDRTLDKL